MKGISNYIPTSRMKDKRQRREQQKAEAKAASKAQTSPAPTKCCGEDCPCDDHAANTRRVTFAQDEPSCRGEDCPCDDHAASTRRVTSAQDEPSRRVPSAHDEPCRRTVLELAKSSNFDEESGKLKSTTRPRSASPLTDRRRNITRQCRTRDDLQLQGPKHLQTDSARTSRWFRRQERQRETRAVSRIGTVLRTLPTVGEQNPCEGPTTKKGNRATGKGEHAQGEHAQGEPASTAMPARYSPQYRAAAGILGGKPPPRTEWLMDFAVMGQGTLGTGQEKYALVVMDAGSDLADAIPTKTREEPWLLLEDLASRWGYTPDSIPCDNAAEFVKDARFKAWRRKHYIALNPVEAYRHKMQVKIENFVKQVKSHNRCALKHGHLPARF